MVFCTTDNKFYVYLASVNNWKELLYGSGTISLFNCGDDLHITHEAGVVAPVAKTVAYGTIANLPGEPSKCWITRNLGAGRQAIEPGDTAVESAGWYWQFNRKQGYMHDGIIRTPNTPWINSINENSGWVSGNDPCFEELGAGWRLPTQTEWSNVHAAHGWTNWTGAWNSGLKLHAAGHLYFSIGLLIGKGSIGYYWSNSQSSMTNAWHLYFSSTINYMNFSGKAYGHSIRCLKE